MLVVPRLIQLEALPDGFFHATAESLQEIIPQPTLIHLPGREKRPLFISILLHGNEPTGFHAVQQLVKKYHNRILPRSISIFIGNVAAAKARVRRLEDQPDYNRVWPGTDHPPCHESEIMQQVLNEMQRRKIFASIDIHNNTGINPHYACVNKLDIQYIQLAHLFSRLVVYFIRPKGVQSAAFAEICPAVTLECGKPGHKFGIEHALEFLEDAIHLADVPDQAIPANDIDLFHTVAQVKISPHIEFSFNNPDTDLLLEADLDHMNFTEIPSETILGRVSKPSRFPIIAKDESGEECTSDYFRIDRNELIFRKTVIEFDQTFHSDTLESHQRTVIEARNCRTPCDNKELRMCKTPVHCDAKTIHKKRLISQLDSPLSVDMPSSKFQMFSPDFKPATSTPRLSIKTRSVKDTQYECDNQSASENNLSGDLFSDMTEGLSLLSFVEAKET